MLRASIVNALGYGLILVLSLNGCAFLSTPKPQRIEISAKPVKKPDLVLPRVDTLNMKPVKWVVLTEENYEAIFTELKKSGRPLTIFGLNDEGYKNLGLNMSAIRALIQQQSIMINAYEAYYKNAETSLDSANQEINNAKKQVEQQQNNKLQ